MLSVDMNLSTFFEEHYVPQVMDNPTTRALEGYRYALRLWRAITSDPPLRSITPATLSTFKQGLRSHTHHGRALATNTVRKYLDHVQWILDQAGPPMAINRLRNAAGLIERVPWTRPPARERRKKPPSDEARVVKVYQAADAATLPIVPGVVPAAWWRALLSTMACTGLRVGQLVTAPYSCVVWDASYPRLSLGADVNRKSGSDEEHPLHPVAFRDLLAIRGDREKLFPAWPTPHAKTSIYDQFHSLERAAGLEPQAGVAFHGIRRRVLTDLAKLSPSAAQLAAGHSSFQTTVQHYLGQEILSDAVRRLGMLEKLG